MELSGHVLVTGGAGFLARALYRRAEREGWPAQFACLSRDDAKHAKLQSQFPAVDTVIGDVGLMGVEELADLMRGFDTVIHAAAEKYVDRAEAHALSCIQTNVVGSTNVARAAMRARVGRVVGISTDKACAPVNIYGATKMAMERAFQHADSLSPTVFTVCRYGNVVGSTGSVVPLFRAMIERGEKLRLTDPRMTRFWMSTDEAIDTVLHAIHRADPGTITIPKARAMPLGDLALIALGYDDVVPLPEDRVEIVGMRPGEKKHEALLHRQESVRARASRRDPHFAELQPPTAAARVEPWEVVSSDAPGYPLPEMRAAIEDAATI